MSARRYQTLWREAPSISIAMHCKLTICFYGNLAIFNSNATIYRPAVQFFVWANKFSRQFISQHEIAQFQFVVQIGWLKCLGLKSKSNSRHIHRFSSWRAWSKAPSFACAIRFCCWEGLAFRFKTLKHHCHFTWREERPAKALQDLNIGFRFIPADTRSWYKTLLFNSIFEAPHNLWAACS